MPKKAYYTSVENSCIYMADGRRVGFTGNYLVTEDEEIQKELDKIAGNSNISHADEAADNIITNAQAMMETKLLADQLAAAAAAQAGVQAEAVTAAGGTATAVNTGAIEASAQEKAAALLASRGR